jgi:hypothetical protein
MDPVLDEPQLVEDVFAIALGQNAGPQTQLIRVRGLSGGLEAASLQKLSVRHTDRRNRTRLHRFVIKRVERDAAREALVYDRVVGPYCARLAPRLFGSRSISDESALLCLESIEPVTWPWRDSGASALVLKELTQLHVASGAVQALPAWNYEQALASSALLTLQQLDALRRHPELSSVVRSSWPGAKRIVDKLSRLRRDLLSYGALGSAAIHGDVHPGNVLLRRERGGLRPVFLDWGRARVGAPLEDVSSWLQSLGHWEPEARKRHDALLGAYLEARGLPCRLSSDFRGAYWLAGACNGLAGALRYHLLAACDAADLQQRAAAAHQAAQWLRVLRRADAYCG